MNERLKRILFASCAVGVLACCALVGATLFLEWKTDRLQVSLLGILEQATTESADAADAAAEAEAQEAAYLEGLRALYAENQDFVGWVFIEGTSVNYPVVQTPQDEEAYLHKDFYGDYAIAGTIFASATSSIAPRSDNVILYGHNMGNGSMFADLLGYTSQDYWQAHQSVQFNTTTALQSYTIAYAFIVDVDASVEHFDFYNFTSAASQQAFDAYIASCAALSLYDTGVEATYGDELLTLVTCYGYDTTQRLVVVAVAL